MKKNDLAGCYRIVGNNAKKALLIMKLTAFIILIFCMAANAEGFSQKVTISSKKVTINSILDQIEKQTGLGFIYAKEQLARLKPVNIDVKNADVKDVLDIVFFNQDLTYSISGNTIVLKEKDQTVVNEQASPSPAEIKVAGRVTDAANSAPLANVSVIIKGTKRGTTTDAGGNFSITASEGEVLQFSYVGYKMASATIKGAGPIAVALIQTEQKSEDVVVVGYGSQKRSSVAGSVVSVKGETLTKNPASNVAQGLQGRLPGLIVNLRTGESGVDNAEILIRGKGTLGYNSPLIVIDGVVGLDDMQRINPNDIESITVLKDASAAIYGAQAANGVILVTRKRGKLQKPTLGYTGNVTFGQPTRLPKLMSASQYAIAENEYLNSVGQPSKWSAADIKAWQDNSDPIQHPNTDWIKEVYRPWTPQQMHTLSLTGGSERVRYYMSGQVTKEDANFRRNDGLAYRQKQFFTALDFDVNNDLTVSVTANYRNQDKELSLFGAGNTMDQIALQSPNIPAYYPNGLEGPSQFGYNPVLMGTKIPGYSNVNSNIFSVKGSFKWKLKKLVDGLYLEGFAAANKGFVSSKRFQKIWYVYSYDPSNQQYVPLRGGQESVNPYLQQNEQKSTNTTYNLKLGYQHTFGKHAIDAFAAYEQNEGNNSFLSASRRDYATDQIEQMFAGSTVGMLNNGAGTQGARQNYFGRLNYGFSNKYYLNLTLRYDGSQNFPPGSRFGFFPSIAAAWKVTNEQFMKNVSFVNDLKIRASWGKMGNDAVPPYQYLATYQYGMGYYFGQNPILYPGLLLSRTPNENITWEIANTKNIGFESQLFNNRLMLNVDLFKSVRDNILTKRNASVPDYTGLVLPDENLGKVSNTGYEIELNYNIPVSGSLKFNIGGNYTYTKNRIEYIDESPNVADYQKRTGRPIDGLYLYQADGLFQSQAEIDKTPHLPNTAPGDIKYTDINKDGVINDADMLRTYASPTPMIMYGFNLGATYKNWDLTIFFQGQAKATAYISPVRLYLPKEFFEGRWQKEGDNQYPRSFVSNRDPIGVNANPSTFWLKDASFMRLKNLQISYTVPQSLLNKVGISYLRFYVSGTNLFTVDKIKIYDPENANSKGSIYPLQRTINAGINLNF